VIYDAIEEVKAAMEGMLAPKVKEQVTATIEVREVFNITEGRSRSRCGSEDRKVKRSDKVPFDPRRYRNLTSIHSFSNVT